MNRRALLTSIGAGTTFALGGCLAEVTELVGVNQGNVPEINSQPCPPYDIDDRVVCSHTVDPNDALVYLSATPQSTGLEEGRPAEQITLELHNQTEDQTLRFNPSSWHIYRFSQSEWAEIPREQGGTGVTELPPGETKRWTFFGAASMVLHEPSFEPGLYTAQLNVGAFYDRDTSERENTITVALVRLGPSR